MNTIARITPRSAASPLAMLDDFFSDPFFSNAMSVPTFITRLEEGSLPLDLSEDNAHVIVRASLPGFTKENIEIEVHDGILSITARQDETREESSERFYKKERRYGSLSRRIALPTAVVETGAVADLKDGVLTLRLPKVQKEQPRKIPVN